MKNEAVFIVNEAPGVFPSYSKVLQGFSSYSTLSLDRMEGSVQAETLRDKGAVVGGIWVIGVNVFGQGGRGNISTGNAQILKFKNMIKNRIPTKKEGM